MPSDQTPRTATLPDSKTANVSGIKSPPKNQPPQTRRKTIDRRDLDEDSTASPQERRTQDRRSSKPASARTKKGKTEQQSALELRHQRNKMRLQQHRKKKLLAGCEPVMGLNYDFLAMDDYPENSLVAAAKRDRDYWILLSSIFGSAFFLGLLELVPAWVAGMGSGLFFMSLVFAFTSVRRHFFIRPPLKELLKIRKTLEFRALQHIAFLEGKDGLAWRCAKMAKYNTNLQRKLFDGLFRYSNEGHLFNVIKNRRHIRLYLLLMIESQKAYKRVQKDYLEHHFKNLDQGWDDSVSDAEAKKLEQQLEKAKQHENGQTDS